MSKKHQNTTPGLYDTNKCAPLVVKKMIKKTPRCLKEIKTLMLDYDGKKGMDDDQNFYLMSERLENVMKRQKR